MKPSRCAYSTSPGQRRDSTFPPASPPGTHLKMNELDLLLLVTGRNAFTGNHGIKSYIFQGRGLQENFEILCFQFNDLEILT